MHIPERIDPTERPILQRSLSLSPGFFQRAFAIAESRGLSGADIVFLAGSVEPAIDFPALFLCPCCPGCERNSCTDCGAHRCLSSWPWIYSVEAGPPRI